MRVGRGVPELPVATAGETQPSKPVGVILRARGIKFRANGLGAEKLHGRRLLPVVVGAPAAQGHRAEQTEEDRPLLILEI